MLTHAPEWGGTEVTTLDTVRALAAAGHEVVLVQLGHDRYDRHAADPTARHEQRQVPLPAATFQSVPFRWWLATLRALHPDVTVFAKGWFDLRSPALDAAARLAGGRYVLMENHPTASVPPDRPVRRMLGGLLPRPALRWWQTHWPGLLHTAVPHRVITNSTCVGARIVRHFGLDPAKIRLVHPGVDLARFTFRAEGRARLRAAWGIPADALVVGSVGRLAGNKALDRAILASRALRDTAAGAEAWLVLAGRGPEEARLRAVAADAGVADRVVLPGFVDDAADACSVLDVYLLSSREEGFGIALVEAMACERVCIAVDSGGPADILTDPSLGWLTPLDDGRALTDALHAAVALTPDERAAMGRRARAHALAHFEVGRQTRRIAELIVSA